MQTLAFAQTDRRLVPRQAVLRPAECKLGGSSLPGTVRDESAYGVFFALDRAHHENEDDAPPYDPELGDLVLLHYRSDGNHQLMLATVKWRGQSAEHGCEGLGLQFDDF